MKFCASLARKMWGNSEASYGEKWTKRVSLRICRDSWGQFVERESEIKKSDYSIGFIGRSGSENQFLTIFLEKSPHFLMQKKEKKTNTNLKITEKKLPFIGPRKSFADDFKIPRRRKTLHVSVDFRINLSHFIQSNFVLAEPLTGAYSLEILIITLLIPSSL